MSFRPTPPALLQYLAGNNVSLIDTLLHVLNQNEPHPASKPLLTELAQKSGDLVAALCTHRATSEQARFVARDVVVQECQDAVHILSRKSTGYHFGMSSAAAFQLESFHMEDMVATTQQVAPVLWQLIFKLMLPAGLQDDEDIYLHPETELWARLEQDEAGQDPEASRSMFTVIKTMVVISIMMYSHNQHCNALQATMAMFLHSCNAPEKLINVLSRAGLSAGVSSINRSTNSLTSESEILIQKFFEPRLVSFVYDNLDIKFNTDASTVDSPGEGLVHFTAVSMLRLAHGVVLEDLDCADEIWNKQDLRLNPHATHPHVFSPVRTLELLYSLHPEPSSHPSGLSRRGRFDAYIFLHTLLHHGPPFFRQYISLLGDPEPVEMIPVTKLEQRPFKAMDINPSSVGGNIEALEALYRQCGYGDTTKGLKDPGNYVQVTFGDLGTFEHVLSAIKQRSVEKTPEKRLQNTVPVPGGFHLKMAAADANHRVLVKPAGKFSSVISGEETCYIKYVSVLRPNETGRLANKPKYRDQHDMMDQVGTAMRLDAWRDVIGKLYDGEIQSLEEFANTKPSFDELQDISAILVREYVAGEGDDIPRHRRQLPAECDEQFENTKLTHAHLLLYEELSRAMNDGDVGRFETVLPAWIQIFRATGKHKYSNRMLLFMHNLYVVYPERLRHCIRYNMFVNPTGKAHKFRAVDWVMEFLNLFIKSVYGGEGSNYTKARILAESPLVLTYRSSHANFERNFRLTNLTSKHSMKDMAEPYRLLLAHMKLHRPNTEVPGRKSTKILQNAMVVGGALILSEDYKMHIPEAHSTETATIDGSGKKIDEGLDLGEGDLEDDDDDGGEDEDLTMEDLSTDALDKM